MFKNKVPNLTAIASYQNVDLITFNYEVGPKKFIAVVSYDKINNNNTSIVEVNPIEVTTPVTFVQTQTSTETITTSSNVQQIQSVNPQVNQIITSVSIASPLIQQYNISQITLTQNDYSNVYQLTYSDQAATTITVRSDKLGNNITV
jgi:hypothetical protein